MSNFECNKLYAKEFWLNGKIVTYCCTFYLLFENGDCLQATYSDEHYIWEVAGVKSVPDFLVAEGDHEFSYKYVEYARDDKKAIGYMLGYEVIGNDILVFKFSSGLEVKLIYSIENESETIKISA
ncbi:hypothetical protein ACFSJY_10195 [Thalassotalea euphylliae]|uniref:hypothetical protein n=1 Tax=Thalassotalea euphylliae TaxID=1655234 RepID=UPI00363D1CD0